MVCLYCDPSNSLWINSPWNVADEDSRGWAEPICFHYYTVSEILMGLKQWFFNKDFDCGWNLSGYTMNFDLFIYLFFLPSLYFSVMMCNPRLLVFEYFWIFSLETLISCFSYNYISTTPKRFIVITVSSLFHKLRVQ